MSKIKQDPGITECSRCGTCCKKGGPCFHLEDKILIEKGIILSKYLYTIREHELCYDNVKDSILPAASDIIKIKAQKDSLACIFFNERENECTVYDNRPLECRALKCWDTREIEKIYSKNRLTRKDLLSNVEGLWGLVEDHQKRCSYEALTLFIDILKKEKKDGALKDILDIIEYDAQIRELVVQKGGLDPEMTDFIFGRPITETIRIYGFKIKKQGDNYHLIPIT
ncbi:MAG: YkgJ family cysteine cluster protein [Deltaproteobacteria bacterium]|nr:YkgJ family cysteine cluster protein [Deltaproteobacteria bacterium]